MAPSFAIKTICYAALVGCAFLLPISSQGEDVLQEAGISVDASANINANVDSELVDKTEMSPSSRIQVRRTEQNRTLSSLYPNRIRKQLF